MPRYFLKIAYDGSQFHGWQKQANAHSIQEEVENALGILLRDRIPVIGCGRTDTGVHAREFFLHFDIQENVKDVQNTIFRLNQILPKSIAVLELLLVTESAHARFDATGRVYRYFIVHEKSPFNQNYAAFYPKGLDISNMNKACSLLVKYKDFTSFSKLHTDTHTNDCIISHAKWEWKDDQLVFEIKANRFLRNMVRAIVGTCLEVGRDKMSLVDFKSVIESKDRQKAGHSAPAKGLFLEKVEYPYLNT